LEHPVAVEVVLDTGSLVVPGALAAQFGTMKDEVLAFGAKVKVIVIAQMADVGPADESRLRLELRRDVLVLKKVAEAASVAVELRLVVLSEGIGIRQVPR